MGRARLLVVDEDNHWRLASVAVVSEAFEVIPMDPDEGLVRQVRRIRPDLVLLALTGVRSAQQLAACRSIKTDGVSPPLVGIVDRSGRLRAPREALKLHQADGYLGGVFEPQRYLAFACAVWEGQQPVVEGDARGLLARLFR
ncbi:MAG: hypothetical protein QGG40_17275 [Myxococcota bacterium]|jgi:DNA-binding response OmpR family regulator|nr:hypothetical protein [Myxococcota bacterium]